MPSVLSESLPLGGPLDYQTGKKYIHQKTRGKAGRKSTTAPVQPTERKHRAQAAMAVKHHNTSKPKIKHDTNPLMRKTKLEADEWTANVMPGSVDCLGCGQTIQLDNRTCLYYRSNWNRHRLRCEFIKSGEKRFESANVDGGGMSEEDVEKEEHVMDGGVDDKVQTLVVIDTPMGLPQSAEGWTVDDLAQRARNDAQRRNDLHNYSEHPGAEAFTYLVVENRNCPPIINYHADNYAPYTPRGQPFGQPSIMLRRAVFSETEINPFSYRVMPPLAAPSFYRGDSRSLLN
ncbi:hypothetical protein FPV67DRAFT_1456200 [Lyophyllum atratum]|nr:hypothetical protein FPV67DRAFT_1456200 [Lyophyllum atratum]